MIGPPTFFVSLMSAPGFSSGAASRACASCRAVAPASPRRSSRKPSDRLGCVVKRTYGSTEAPTIATSRPDDDRRRRPPQRRSRHRLGATARERPRAGTPKAPGESGELWVQGPELFSGYLDAADTEAAVDDGWFRTGDLATLDADGWLAHRRAHQGPDHPGRREHRRGRGRGGARTPPRGVAGRRGRLSRPADGRAGVRVRRLRRRRVRPRRVPRVVRGPGRRAVQDARAGRGRRRAPAPRDGQARPRRAPRAARGSGPTPR